MPILDAMGRKVAIAAFALLTSPVESHALAPLYDPVVLNVGINCQWQRSCERRQLNAMNDSRRYIAREHPPLWRIHLCNRNAARSAARIDWVGFNSCIRNLGLRAPRARR
jgi:hypothetical protein